MSFTIACLKEKDGQYKLLLHTLTTGQYLTLSTIMLPLCEIGVKRGYSKLPTAFP